MAPSPSAYDLKTAEVARQLGVSQDTVAKWADDDLIHCIKTIGGWRKFRQADIDAFIESLQRTGPGAA